MVAKPPLVRLSTLLWAALLLSPAALPATLVLPTPNRALLTPDPADRYFVGTVGKPWTSGTFGCTRSSGTQMHEGIDIRAVQRDRAGEPTDPVFAIADGQVAYINSRPSLSNFGRYLILRHSLDGLEIYTLYAHLASVRDGLKAGSPVKAGDAVAVLGRSTNTRQGISRDRAHVHFEIGLLVNDGFPAWYKKNFPGQRNDHGPWNGQNLVGLDPALVLRQTVDSPSPLNLLAHLQNQTELCRVLVRDTAFPWLNRYRPLVARNPKAETEGVAGYEISLNYAGVPFRLVPRAPSEVTARTRTQLLAVNADEQRRHPCRKLVVRRGNAWELGRNGQLLLTLLTH